MPLLDIYRPKSGRRSLATEPQAGRASSARRACSARRVYAGVLVGGQVSREGSRVVPGLRMAES